MLRRCSPRELIVTCEECGRAATWAGTKFFGVLEYADFVRDLRIGGWRFTRDGDHWKHTCPDCVAEDCESR